jgi:hypothetical protein
LSCSILNLEFKYFQIQQHSSINVHYHNFARRVDFPAPSSPRSTKTILFRHQQQWPNKWNKQLQHCELHDEIFCLIIRPSLSSCIKLFLKNSWKAWHILITHHLQIIYIYITICHPKLISTTQNSLGTLEFRLWEDFVQT